MAAVFCSSFSLLGCLLCPLSASCHDLGCCSCSGYCQYLWVQCSPLKSHAPLIAGVEDSKGALLGQFGCSSLQSSVLGSFHALITAQQLG